MSAKVSEILKQYREAVGNKLDKSVETLKIAQLGIELEKAVRALEAECEVLKEQLKEPNECPRCGRELSEDFDAVDIDIDLQTGFVCLTRKCECGAKLQLFFDYDRTEEE